MVLKGEISEILKLNNESDGKYLFLLTINQNTDIPCQKDGRVLCKAYPTLISKAEPVKLIGEFEDQIFNVSKVDLTYYNKDSIINYIICACKGKRIGKALVLKIVEKYKETILTIGATKLEQNILKDFPTIDIIKAKTIVGCLYYKHNHILGNLEDLFEGENIDSECLINIYTKYGDSSVKKIKQNPYTIGLEFDIRLSIIDNIAFKIGIPYNSDLRIEGLLHYTLENAASQGHTWVNAVELVKKVSNFSYYGKYSEILYPIYISNAAITSKKIIVNESKISLKKYYIAEKVIASRLNALNQTKTSIQITKADINTISEELSCTFGKDQRNAFRILEHGGIAVLTGGPGTGKTTLVKGLVKLYLKKAPDANVIAFCAPTGRAAKRLSESSGYNAKTIHKLLEYKPFENGLCIKKTQADPINADFIIVDEFSMVDVELMAMLLEAIKQGTKLLLVGDENQLPSIGAGNLLHDIIASEKFPVYRLNENFRQKGEGSIIDNSERILKGEKPIINNDFHIYQAKDENDAFNGLCYFMRELYKVDSPFETQLIEPSKKGTAGTYRMNQYVHQNIVHKDVSNISSSPALHDKIIFKVTDYEAGYVNGDIGIVKSLTSDELTVWNDSETLVMSAVAIKDMEFAYAYTIHKSQGSENNNIIIYLPEEMSHMMTRSLFYTAVTRAKKTVTIIYTGEALTKCLSNVSDKKRNTLLKDFL